MIDQVLAVIQYLALTVWVGGMTAFAILFAPELFRRVHPRSAAGEVAGAVIARVDAVGLVAGGLLTMVTLLQAMAGAWTGPDTVRLALSLAMTGLILANTTVVRQRLDAVRVQLPQPLEGLPEDHPLKEEHARLHRRSVQLWGLVLLAGYALIILSALR